ncbi:ElyC/SanA/YdcF family protein [Alkalinema sp. FACHB-956]|uniref:ElyC/SanA/YdcF family protein n=1 Tax=Alkalinema sp. FACHB-956 TaxID=2692768 RepID=UPI001684D5BE|nr:YdcF family protein [Alkalinema sp. FACHB-956]
MASLQFKLKLFRRREIWCPTWRGWLLLGVLLLGLGLGVVPRIHPFFAVTAPISAEALVVEGWMDDEAVIQAIAEFKSHPYQLLITTGSPLPKGFYLAQYQNFAELSKATLIQRGFPVDRIVAVPAPFVIKNRTYTAALSVKQWLERTQSSIRAINIFTTGAHARRSWMLYRRALEPQFQVGVIATPPQTYEVDRWWASSEGVKMVIFEALGWFYVQVFNRLD